MARIRTIKPEFPQSESMGRISRDARLCFILMWTVADDSGRLRGNSRMLASLLFPYDDDAVGQIEGWLEELADEGVIHRYQVDGCSYIEIAKWLIHQKIDKPSASKLPAFDEHSPNPREDSRSLVVGVEGKGVEGKGSISSARPTRTPEVPPPYTDIVAAYHELLPELPSVRLLEGKTGEKRRKAMRDFWAFIFSSKRSDGQPRATNGTEALEWVRSYFARVRDNQFLMGSRPNATWKADFDFLLTEKGRIHVIERTQEAA